MQVGQQDGVIIGKDGFIQTAASGGLGPEQLQGGGAAVGQGEVGNRYAIPVQALLAQQEAVQRRAFEFLFSAAAAVVVFTLVADGIRVGVNHDFQQVQAVLLFQIDIHHDAQHVADFIGQVFQQFAGVGDTYGLAMIIAANDKGAAFGVGEGADPFQVVVPPGLLPFDVLVFGGCHLSHSLPSSE